MKRSLHLMLSEAALIELERRAGGRDKRQAYLEGMLSLKFDDPLAIKLAQGQQAESAEDQVARMKREAPLQANISPLRQAKLCEHGVAPSLCKYRQCRKT